MNKKAWKRLKKSSSTIFWVRVAPKSWSKYTTNLDHTLTLDFSRSCQAENPRPGSGRDVNPQPSRRGPSSDSQARNPAGFHPQSYDWPASGPVFCSQATTCWLLPRNCKSFSLKIGPILRNNHLNNGHLKSEHIWILNICVQFLNDTTIPSNDYIAGNVRF